MPRETVSCLSLSPLFSTGGLLQSFRIFLNGILCCFDYQTAKPCAMSRINDIQYFIFLYIFNFNICHQRSVAVDIWPSYKYTVFLSLFIQIFSISCATLVFFVGTVVADTDGIFYIQYLVYTVELRRKIICRNLLKLSFHLCSLATT